QWFGIGGEDDRLGASLVQGLRQSAHIGRGPAGWHEEHSREARFDDGNWSMLEVRGRIRRGYHITGLLELECGLQRGTVAEAAPKDSTTLHRLVAIHLLRDLGLAREHRAHGSWHGLQGLYQRRIAREQGGEQAEHG